MKFGPVKLERIITFDILRGFFLVVIILNHLYYYPSGLEWLTGRGHLYVSSAEGFFVISGLMLGLVRGRKLIDKPLRVASKLILSRAFQLYAVFVVLTIGYTLIAWMIADQPGLKAGYAPIGTPITQLIWETISLQYMYGWIDFLRLYVIFMLATPLALWLLRRGWWYIVLAISGFIWTLFPDDTTYSQGFMLMPISWQFVFYSGLVIGFHWPEIVNLWRRLAPTLRTAIGASLAVAMVATALWSAALVYGDRLDIEQGSRWADMHREIEYDNFDKNRLPIPRLALGAVWFWALFWLVRRFEDWFKKWTGWLLIPFGQHSLYVYIVHSAIVLSLHLVWAVQYREIQSLSKLPINLALSVGAILIIWLLVRNRILFKIIPR